jgi:uncharacterized repeat protein (TIGR03803 family)
VEANQLKGNEENGMKRKSSVAVLAALAMIAFTLSVAPAAMADTETALYNFTGGSDGGTPIAGLVMDSSGNLYGAGKSGGADSSGVVFELTPNGSGGWTYNVLYSFTGGNDGAWPKATLVFDSQGNLYGTCSAGGQYGWGTVFELSPSGGGNWTLGKTYSFTGNADGGTAIAPVILDSVGNLYGTTQFGGALSGDEGFGTVFELTPSGSSWTEQTLHTFTGGNDGSNPDVGAGVVWDRAGNLYGTTLLGGSYGAGVVYKLHNTRNNWVETVVYNFTGNSNGDDGSGPLGNLTIDNLGRIYGATYYTTQNGGCGGVFALNPQPNATAAAEQGWQIAWLHHFTGTDGCWAAGGVTFDSAGNLYGATLTGGTGYGVVYKLTPSPWTESTLWTFSGDDGEYPRGGFIFDAAGDLYGTAMAGGTQGAGTVFELTQ